MSEWISVEDRLPENDELVIVSGGVAYVINGIWITHMGMDSGRPIQWEVTHWMPIPEPPK